jgi:hypothetical protein
MASHVYPLEMPRYVHPLEMPSHIYPLILSLSKDAH